MFRLHYYVQNNGDGSCTVIFCETEKEATEKDKEQNEDHGWAEPSVGYVDLEAKHWVSGGVEEGIDIVRKDKLWDSEIKKALDIQIPLEEIK